MSRSIINSNVVVIGGAGFLGSHLVDHLVEDRNCRVLVVDNLCVGQREFIHKKAQFWHHDITGSEDQLRKRLVDFNCQFVMNYAAWPYIPNSYTRPLHVFDVNAFGALKIINAAQEAEVEAILQVSSAEVYGSAVYSEMCKQPHQTWDGRINEDHPVVPHSSYGASKAAIDALCQVAWRERQTPVIALRQFNALGPRETHPYVVPEIISQLAGQCGTVIGLNTIGNTREWLHGRGRPGSVFLGNNSSRDFMAAKDAVRIACILLEKGQFGEVYNLGSEESIKIYDLAASVGRVMGFSQVDVVEDPGRVRPWEIWHLQSDNTKISQVVGKQTLQSLDDTLASVVEYYSNTRKWCWE